MKCAGTKASLFFLLLGALGSATGCQHQAPPVSPAIAAEQLTTEQQIVQIENNPKMPPQVKASMIAKLRGTGGRPLPTP